MSGLEIIGIAASVIQIAELGGQLSVKLFTFGRKIKNADKNIESISQEIASTGAVLQQLGHTLRKDDHSRLYSEEAVRTAQDLIADCNKIFIELNDALDGRSTGSKLVTSWKQRLRYPYVEEQVEMLRSNLERLKSSLLVILNILILAEQIRNREALPMLRDQRALIEILVEESNSSNSKFEEITKRINSLKMDGDANASSSLKGNLYQQFNLNAVQINQISTPAPPSTQIPSGNTLKGLPSHRSEEIVHHSTLVNELVENINAVQWKINHGLRHQMHERILETHWQEWSKLRILYGDDAILTTFSEHEEVLRFWRSRIESEALAKEQYQLSVTRRLPTHLLQNLGDRQSLAGKQTLQRMQQQNFRRRPMGSTRSDSLKTRQDYELQLMMLEQWQKNKLMMETEQDTSHQDETLDQRVETLSQSQERNEQLPVTAARAQAIDPPQLHYAPLPFPVKIDRDRRAVMLPMAQNDHDSEIPVARRASAVNTPAAPTVLRGAEQSSGMPSAVSAPDALIFSDSHQTSRTKNRVVPRAEIPVGTVDDETRKPTSKSPPRKRRAAAKKPKPHKAALPRAESRTVSHRAAIESVAQEDTISPEASQTPDVEMIMMLDDVNDGDGGRHDFDDVEAMILRFTTSLITPEDVTATRA